MLLSHSHGNPISNIDQSIHLNSFSPNSKQDEDTPNSYFFSFPSPFNVIDYNDHENNTNNEILANYNDMLFQHHQPLIMSNKSNACQVETMTMGNNMMSTSNTKRTNKRVRGKKVEKIPRKRYCNRDRHSKIDTARGPRDRRMRLSLEIARPFFHLQDLLGFDKASKTVDWLLKQSEHAIKLIYRSLPQFKEGCSFGAKSSPSASECEVVSGIDKTTNINGDHVMQGKKPSKEKDQVSSAKVKKVRQLRKIAPFHPLARESRTKARARARERTLAKMGNYQKTNDHQSTQSELCQFGSCSPFEANEDQESVSLSNTTTNTTNNMKPIVQEDYQQFGSIENAGVDHDHQDYSNFITGNWSPPSNFILNYRHSHGISQEANSNNNSNKFPELQQNWDTDTTKTYTSFCTTITTTMHESAGSVPPEQFTPNMNNFLNPQPENNYLQPQFGELQYCARSSWEVCNNINFY
ncbi:Transcription factor TCP subgroup [Dillenia turbinata]|uniref:Transcription factor TCP subgroup n=1 Tax=Dillenia turbinata TaxID=194707 RepID=A0AAN8UXP9_9MAGN